MKVLLVDGVGNAVVYERSQEVLWVETPGGHVFVKTCEIVEGMEVYRLKGSGAPAVRHIYPRLAA
jgi:hypothetical protein